LPGPGAFRYRVEADLVIARVYQQYGDFQAADAVCGGMLGVLDEESGP